MIRVLVGVASALALTACGLEIIPIPPNQQLPDRAGLFQAPWLLLGGDGEELELGVMKGTDDCDRFSGVDVIQTNQGVDIRAWIESIRTDACTLELVIHHTTVSLDEPLGPRPLTGCLIENSGVHSTRRSCADIVE